MRRKEGSAELRKQLVGSICTCHSGAEAPWKTMEGTCLEVRTQICFDATKWSGVCLWSPWRAKGRGKVSLRYPN